jgi:hypothetical protein
MRIADAHDHTYASDTLRPRREPVTGVVDAARARGVVCVDA